VPKIIENGSIERLTTESLSDHPIENQSNDGFKLLGILPLYLEIGILNF